MQRRWGTKPKANKPLMDTHPDCSKVLSKVFLALDGELTVEEEREFLEHLQKCSCCLDQFHIEKAFKEFLIKKIHRKKVASTLVSDIKKKIKKISVE